jgi:hypothetical protein
MPKVEIDVTDDGKIGTLPEPVQKFVDGLIGDAHKRAYEKAAAEAKRQGYDPVERERLTQLEAEKKAREIADLERDKKYEEAQKLRDERHQKDLAAKDEAINQREARIRKGLRADIRAAALRHGAREESLDELALILSGDLDLDSDLEPYVKGTDGKPAASQDGKPVSIEGHVNAYLDTHPHHRKAPAGQGGGARGGASFAGATSDAANRHAAAKERLERGDRSPAVMREFLQAQREMQSATGKGA